MKTLPAGGRLLVLDETTLRHLPPLRAAWALRGQQAQVRIRGQNARRSLFGTIDLRTGRRVLMASRHQRLADFHRFYAACATGWERAGRSGCCLTATAAIKAPAACAWPKGWASACSGCRASIPSSTRWTTSGVA